MKLGDRHRTTEREFGPLSIRCFFAAQHVVAQIKAESRCLLRPGPERWSGRAHRHVQGRMPRMIDPRRSCQPVLANDLHIEMKDGTRFMPGFVRDIGPRSTHSVPLGLAFALKLPPLGRCCIGRPSSRVVAPRCFRNPQFTAHSLHVPLRQAQENSAEQRQSNAERRPDLERNQRNEGLRSNTPRLIRRISLSVSPKIAAEAGDRPISDRSRRRATWLSAGAGVRASSMPQPSSDWLHSTCSGQGSESRMEERKCAARNRSTRNCSNQPPMGPIRFF